MRESTQIPPNIWAKPLQTSKKQSDYTIISNQESLNDQAERVRLLTS